MTPSKLLRYINGSTNIPMITHTVITAAAKKNGIKKTKAASSIMKKFYTLFALLSIGSLAHADVITNRLSLDLPVCGSQNWCNSVNGDFQILDATTNINGFGPYVSTKTITAGSNITVSTTATGVSISAQAGMTSGATYYIQNTNTLQTGATFYVSSGTVAGQLTAGSFVGNGSGLTGLPPGMVSGATYYANINPASPQSGGISVATGTFSYATQHGASNGITIKNTDTNHYLDNCASASFWTNVSTGATIMSCLQSNLTVNDMIFSLSPYSAGGSPAEVMRLTTAGMTLATPLAVAQGGTGTTSPTISAGTNITSVTGTWPNVTINAATQGGSSSSPLAISSGSATSSVIVTSPTTNVVFDSNTISVALQGPTTSFIGLTSSVTQQGVITAASLGAASLSSTQTFTGQNTFNATVTVSSNLVVNAGPGNLSFTETNGVAGQIMLSTTVPTAGQLPILSSSMTVIATPLRSTILAVDSNGVLISTTVTSSGSSGSGSGTITASTQYQVPFYSVTGSSNVVVGSATLTNDGANLTIDETTTTFKDVKTITETNISSMTISTDSASVGITVLISSPAFLSIASMTWTSTSTVINGPIGLNGPLYTFPSTVGTAGGIFTVNTSSAVGISSAPTLSGTNITGIPAASINAGTLGASVVSSDTLLGDMTGTGNSPLTVTAAATQANITTLSNGAGITVSKGITASSMTLSSIATPSAAATGSIWNDSNYNAFMSSAGSVLQNIPSGLFSIYASSTSTGTATAVAWLGSVDVKGSITLPTNFFTVGKTIYIVLEGTHTRTGTPTLTPTITLGGTTILSTGAITMGAYTNETQGQPWKLEATLTCYSTGVSGVIKGHGLLRFWNSDISGTSTVLNLQSGTNTINTAAAQALQFNTTWSATPNSITIMSGYGMVLF